MLLRFITDPLRLVPRKPAFDRKADFFFSGPERARNGDILSRKIDLFVNDTLKDSKKSFLWE